MPGDQPITEDELHAYVDGNVEPARRLDIALYLARHPDDAARMEAFRAQREAIHAVFDDFLLQPVPRRLRNIVRRHAARLVRRRRGAGMLVGIAVASVVLVTGRIVVQHPWPYHDSAAAAAPQHDPAADELPVIRPLGPLEQRTRNFDI